MVKLFLYLVKLVAKKKNFIAEHHKKFHKNGNILKKSIHVGTLNLYAGHIDYTNFTYPKLEVHLKMYIKQMESLINVA